MILFYLRDPKIDDHQNMLIHRPYCGNPFIAPGTIGSKAKKQGGFTNGNVTGAIEEEQAELGGLADEAAFFNNAGGNNNE